MLLIFFLSSLIVTLGPECFQILLSFPNEFRRTKVSLSRVLPLTSSCRICKEAVCRFNIPIVNRFHSALLPDFLKLCTEELLCLHAYLDLFWAVPNRGRYQKQAGEEREAYCCVIPSAQFEPSWKERNFIVSWSLARAVLMLNISLPLEEFLVKLSHK